MIFRAKVGKGGMKWKTERNVPRCSSFDFYGYRVASSSFLLLFGLFSAFDVHLFPCFQAFPDVLDYLSWLMFFQKVLTQTHEM